MSDPARQSRLAFIDNIRWVMIVLVICMHAAVTYSHLGSWYFMEGSKPTHTGTLLFFAYFQMGLQAFFMGLLFLIAGYFVPGAYDRKGPRRFLRDRFVRLCVPALFYMFVVHPFIVYGLLRDHYQVTRPFLEAYLSYLRGLRFLGSSGPMWFTLALFVFCLVYAQVRRVRPGVPSGVPDSSLPTNRQVALLALVMGLCTFLVRVVQPMGTNILNMQLCFFSQYVLLFWVGVLAWRRDWLSRIPYEFGRRWLRWTLVVGSLVWLFVLGLIVATHTEPAVSGGFTWQSAAICFWESFFCVGLCLGVIVSFRAQYNRLGRFEQWMSDNCFAVYLFHPPILIALTLWWRSLEAPKPVKFLCASALGSAITFLASSLVFRRIPVLKRIL